MEVAQTIAGNTIPMIQFNFEWKLYSTRLTHMKFFSCKRTTLPGFQLLTAPFCEGGLGLLPILSISENRKNYSF